MAFSSDNVYRGDDTTVILTDELDRFDTELDAMELNKASTNHNHSGVYSPVNHTHTGYASSSHTHSEYASSEHTHTPDSIGAASSTHTHADKADLVNGVIPISQIPNEVKEVRIVANIAARNALTGLFAGLNVYVTDATGDSTVSSGGAYYLYDGTNWIKTAESESLDLVLSWANIQGKPTALAADGGNADTVDNKHASDFATAGHTHTAADVGASPTEHNHNSLYSLLNHIHGTTPVTTADEDLDDYNIAGVYSFAAAYQPVNRPSGTSNGWLVVIPWTSNTTTQTVKQFWLRHGSLGTNDNNIYVRTKVGDYGWSEWSKIWTTKDMTIIAEDGDVYVSWTGQNVIEKFSALGSGMYTAYSRGGSSAGTTNAPNTNEGWRYLCHKTGAASYGWIIGFGTSGSIYTGYLDNGTWKGWKCLYEAGSQVLWSGALYMREGHTVTPSKKLSECKSGWILLWSDYDESTSTVNDADFVTTIIPKKNPSGTNWSGKSFYCEIPRYIGSDQSNVTTESRIMKMIYIYDDKITGHAANNQSVRTDVVLRAVYEF